MLGDPRFFAGRGPFPLAAVAAAAGAAVPTGADGARLVRRPATLDAAGPDAVSFLETGRYAAQLTESRAGACLMRPNDAAKAPAGMVVLACDQPYLAWARVLALFFPAAASDGGGVAPGASVHPSAMLAAGVTVRAGAVVSARTVVGAGSVIGENAVLGEAVVIGAGCDIGAGATLSHAILGDRVVVGPGVRIGQAGFGFVPGPRGFVPVPQLGRVLIGDDVDIGANTTVDRGSGQDTVIGAGTRIDNLVQVAHNCRIGRLCAIASQVGLSGSTILEDGVMMGGQAGSSGHLRIGARSRIGAQSGIIGDVPAGADYLGSPAMPIKETWRAVAALKRLAAPPSRETGRGAADTDKA
jgi:UDP-3-O-[3-hydroxymyristoyl] glucosamine N-acyltransferase